MNYDKLYVSGSGRYICSETGAPLTYLADTAWGLFHKLSREDAAMYLSKRAGQGFTAVQCVLLDECGGLTVPNAHGRLPLLAGADGVPSPLLPDLRGDYSYWDHVDFIVAEAERLGLTLAILPTWGDKFNKKWGEGPEIFTPESAYSYAKWVGERYKDAVNIIWVTGGDRPLETRLHFETVCAMAKGLRDGDGGRHLITFHPTGGKSSSENLHGEDWLDFNMIQSGHSRYIYNYLNVSEDYNKLPPKPVIDAESCYEHHPESFNPENGYIDEIDVRQKAYWAVMSGAFGHTYGDHSVWGFFTPPVEGFQENHFCTDWRSALDAPGAREMRHLRALLEDDGFFSTVPDPGALAKQFRGTLFIPVRRGGGALYAYSAQGTDIVVRDGVFSGKPLAHWFSPRDGSWSRAASSSVGGALAFSPPTKGRGNDWVLRLRGE